MKTPKRKSLLALLILIPKLVKAAAVEIGLAIMTLIVGGIIIYCLYRLTKTVLPDNPPPNQQPTNQVSGTYMIKWDYSLTFSNNYMLGEIWGGLNPYTEDGYRPGQEPAALANPLGGFTVQYGLTIINTNPWMAIGSNQPDISAQFVGIQTLVDTTNEYRIAVTINDWTMVYDTTNFNSSDTTYDTQTIITNAYTPVAIERSPNLLTWQTLYTNAILAGQIYTFTDPNPPAPPSNAFYRLRMLTNTN